MTDDAARRERAARRRERATLTVTTAANDRPPAPETAIERLALMWPLAREAWLLSGRPLPEYRREETPIRVVRRGEEQ